MIHSYEDFLKVVKTLTLAESNNPTCHYLEGSTKEVDHESKSPFDFFLSGEHFEHAFQNAPFSHSENPPPAWIEKRFLEMVSIFTERGAYGSVMGLVEFFGRYGSAEQKIIDMIKKDKVAEQPILNQLAYNFLLIAAAYCSAKTLMLFLLGDCGVDINYQTPKYKITAAMYATRYCSLDTFRALIDCGIKTRTIDLNLKNKWNTTLLGSAANGLYFNKGRGMLGDRIDEFKYLLENGACALDSYALYEAMRHTGYSLEAGLTMLRHGAGLLKPHLRVNASREPKITAEQLKLEAEQDLNRWRTVEGFDMDKYLTCSGVLVGIDKDTTKPVFFYGTDGIFAALKAPNIEIDRTNISKHLSKASLEDLNSEFLSIFVPTPAATFTKVAKDANENEKEQEPDTSSSSRCRLM